MRFTIAFGLLSIALVVLAVRLARDAAGAWWMLVVLESYVAVCLLTLAAAYGFRGAGLAVEDLLGRPGWSPALRAILLPYLSVARLTLYLSRWFDHEDLMNRFEAGLYVGRMPFRSERPRLVEAGITAILNLCWEFPPRPGRSMPPSIEVVSIPILDACPPSHRQFRAAVEQVRQWRSDGRTVLIHCAQGHGRSAIVAAAVLCRLGVAPDAESALGQIRTVRPRARPSRAQREGLKGYLARSRD